MCIASELAVHDNVGGVAANYMGVAVDDGVSILIISFSATIILCGSCGFRHCGISTLLLMLNFCAVDFSIILSTLPLRSLYSDSLFNVCSCTARMITISCCCDANYLLSCRIALAVSSLSPPDPVVWCLMLDASLVKKSLKLFQFLALVGLSRQE